MSSTLSMPQIMKPGELKRINDWVFKKINTPIFFAVEELPQPKGRDGIGNLYEIITGLYSVYKDYGMRLFQTYLYFCKKEVDNTEEHLHFLNDIKTLRGGICHGSIAEGGFVREFTSVMDKYYDRGGRTWPTFISELNELQCEHVAKKISERSDKLVRYIVDCTEKIAADSLKLLRWKSKVNTEVFNAETEKYEGKKFFDARIVMDLEKAVQNGRNVQSSVIIVGWLRDSQEKIINCQLQSADELKQSLIQALYDAYNPTPLSESISSADKLFGDL